MQIKFLYPVIFAFLFIACDAKSQKAQEVKNGAVEYTTAPIAQNNFTLTTTNQENISFELSNNILSSKKTQW